MSKSLTQVAKQILMTESDDPTPDRGARAMTSNSATLRPGSRYADMAPFGNPGAMSAMPGQFQQIGSAPNTQAFLNPAPGQGEMAMPNPGGNLGAAASGMVKKDMSPSSQGARGASAEPFGANKGNPESMEDDMYNDDDEDNKKQQMAEDLEISEELQAFIAEKAAQGLSEEEIARAIDENFELVEESEGSYQVDMSEHVDALLAGESLSEEFRAKATTIFEAAVNQKLTEEVSRLEEAYAESLAEEVAAITSQLTENVDDYLSYVVEQWMSENEIAIEHGLRTELTEDFISGLRQLFAENYIDIPEDRVSVVEELGRKVEELEVKLNEEIDRNVSLNKMINESRKYEILASACDGLTNTQVERLKALSEGIEFTDANEYQNKLLTLRESYFPVNVRNSNVLDRVESENNSRVLSEETDGRMAAYVRTLGKKLPN